MDLDDQDVSDLYTLINHYLDPPKNQKMIKPDYAKRLLAIKERLLKIEVNTF